MISDRLLNAVELQSRLIGSLSMQTLRMLFSVWNGYRWWTDYDRGLAQAARTAAIIEAAMRQTRLRENAYLSQVYKDLGIELPDQSRVTVSMNGGKYPRIGVTPLDVYQRPLETFRYLQSTGKTAEVSFTEAMSRLSTMATTDISMARREQSQLFFEETNKKKRGSIIGYRRIIHPELSRTGTCGLCVVAATRMYYTSELMPIHDDCNCDVLPVTKNDDPGLQLNDDDLQRIYQAAGGTGAGGLLKTKIHFTEHGELGPIITGGNRQGSKQRKHAANRKPMSEAEMVRNQLEVLRASSSSLQRRLDNGEDVSQPLQWQKDRIMNLQAQLRSLGIEDGAQ